MTASMAVCRAGAAACNRPLYRYIASWSKTCWTRSTSGSSLVVGFRIEGRAETDQERPCTTREVPRLIRNVLVRRVLRGIEIRASLYDEGGAKTDQEIMDKAEAKDVEIVMPVDFACPSKFSEDGGIPAGVRDPRSGHEKSSTRKEPHS
jgi:hypothetical protein